MIKKLKYGNTNTYLIVGEKANLLVDTDYPDTINLFYKEIKKNNIKLNDITYVLATHYHPDHIGLISQLKAKGIKHIVIDKQINYLNYSDVIFKKNKVYNYQSINFEDSIILRCDNSRSFLGDLGIAGEIVYTPSHSNDSISVVLDSGCCLVGDLAPLDHIFNGEEELRHKEDWKKLLQFQPSQIFYSHYKDDKIK